LLGWQYLSQTFLYKSVDLAYTKFIGHLTLWLANIFGQYPTLEYPTYNLSFNEKVKSLAMPTGSYPFYIAAFLLLLVVPIRDYKYSFIIIVSSIFFIAFRAATISLIQLIYPQNMILLLWIDPLIYIPMFAIILFISNKNLIIKHLYTEIRALFIPILNVSLPTLILLLLLLTPIPRVILNYLNRDIIDGIITITLKISKIILGWFGYETVVTAKYLFLDKFWLRLEQPCLGIGVITIVWILVCSIKGQWQNKSIFLILFTLLFVLMNSIRLSVLLLAIKKTYQTGLNKVELHDNITYAMYLFAFISFLVYYFWFQDIKLTKSLRKELKQK
jgi:exosortase/archaeosortase family protein